jgi:hypothetical protein
MSQATQNVVEDTGSVTVCAEINSTTLPFQKSATVQIFSVSSSAGSKLSSIIMTVFLRMMSFFTFFMQMNF